MISAGEYNGAIDDIEQDILQTVERLQEKVLDHTEGAILSSEMKMLDIRKDELHELERAIRSDIGYSREYDADFLHANGDYSKAL